MQKEIIVEIRTEHFRRASYYSCHINCPLALAVKDVVNISSENNYRVSCILGSVTIGNPHNMVSLGYGVTDEWNSKQTLYTGDLKGKSIDQMIIMAKEDPTIEFPPLVLKLTWEDTFMF
jgi:hypothetical protein